MYIRLNTSMMHATSISYFLARNTIASYQLEFANDTTIVLAEVVDSLYLHCTLPCRCSFSPTLPTGNSRRDRC